MAEISVVTKKYTLELSEEEFKVLHKLIGNVDVKTVLSKKFLDTEVEFDLIYKMYYDLKED